jgi:hypothetical protein
MLVIVGGMLAAFATFFVYLMRRARLANLTDEDHKQPHEGIA